MNKLKKLEFETFLPIISIDKHCKNSSEYYNPSRYLQVQPANNGYNHRYLYQY